MCVCVNLKISGPQILDHFVALPPSPSKRKSDCYAVRILSALYSYFPCTN